MAVLHLLWGVFQFTNGRRRHQSDESTAMNFVEKFSAIELEFAVKAQIEQLQRGAHPEPDCVIGSQALKEALVELSKKKCRTYLQAEFPQFWADIRRFENAKAEHNNQSLQKLLGKDCHEKIDDLLAIGFLQKRPLSKSFIIPFLFRPGLAVRQGKAF